MLLPKWYARNDFYMLFMTYCSCQSFSFKKQKLGLLLPYWKTKFPTSSSTCARWPHPSSRHARPCRNSLPLQTLLPLFGMSFPISLFWTIFTPFLKPTQISASPCGCPIGLPQKPRNCCAMLCVPKAHHSYFYSSLSHLGCIIIYPCVYFQFLNLTAGLHIIHLKIP